MKHQRKNSKDKRKSRLNIPSTARGGFLRCSVLGAISSLGIAILLGVVVSIILFKTSDPLKFIVPSALSILYISTMLGGYIASRINKRSPIICGLLSSLFVLLFSLLVSLFVPVSHSSGYDIFSAIGLRLAVIVSSVVGAFIGTNYNKSKNTKKKRKR